MLSHWLRMQQIALIVLLWSIAAAAQTAGSNAGQSQSQPDGWEGGGYVIHQSIEIGYRASDITGSEQMYNTLVNLRSGPRFLEQSLSMQSQNHDGLLFDNLFVNSYGWGGDPNNGLRARVEKNSWYDFRANFRRDQQDFDYNLLGQSSQSVDIKPKHSRCFFTPQLRNPPADERLRPDLVATVGD